MIEAFQSALAAGDRLRWVFARGKLSQSCFLWRFGYNFPGRVAFLALPFAVFKLACTHRTGKKANSRLRPTLERAGIGFRGSRVRVGAILTAMGRGNIRYAFRSVAGMDRLRIAARQGVRLVCVIALCEGLLACAEDRTFPSLSKITDTGSTLSPEQRDKAIQDLQKQSQTNTSAASKTAD